MAVATGWQTVAQVLRLPGASARAYLVQDHEPEFYPTSAEREWAAWTYRQGLHCIAASPWLADLVRTRYGAERRRASTSASTTSAIARPTSRAATTGSSSTRAPSPRGGRCRWACWRWPSCTAAGRRSRSRSSARRGPIAAPFPHRALGVLEAAELARAYSEATVGLVLSLTNPSLIPQEMLACGLPCVDVASESMLATYGADGPATLAAPEPIALCEAIEALLDDAPRRAEARRGAALGRRAHVAGRRGAGRGRPARGGA